MSDLTLIVCTYNNARMLRDALVAIEQQRVTGSLAWSTLVVDNNSTDETRLVVQHCSERGRIPGLRYVRETRQGLVYARQRGVRDTTASIIAFVDDDCLLAPDWVEQAFVSCCAHPRAGVIGGRIRLQWEAPPDDFLLAHAYALAQQDYGDSAGAVDGYARGLVGAGLVMRREALAASGWLDSPILVGRRGRNLTSGDDTEIVLRIRGAGYELWYDPAMRMEHRIPLRRISRGYVRRLYRSFGQSWPILTVLHEQRRPTTRYWLWQLLVQAMGLVRTSLAIAIRDVLGQRRIAPERPLQLNWRLGALQGIWQALRGRYEF